MKRKLQPLSVLSSIGNAIVYAALFVFIGLGWFSVWVLFHVYDWIGGIPAAGPAMNGGGRKAADPAA